MPNERTLPERIIGLIEVSSVMAEKSAAEETKRLSMQKEAQAFIPGLVDTLATLTVPDRDGRRVPMIEPDEKTACAVALQDPVMALSILTKVANFYKADQADAIGQPVPREKKASDAGPYAGRRTSDESPAWRKFRNDVMGG